MWYLDLLQILGGTMAIGMRTIHGQCLSCHFVGMAQDMYPCRHDGDEPSESNLQSMLEKASEVLQSEHDKKTPTCMSIISVH